MRNTFIRLSNSRLTASTLAIFLAVLLTSGCVSLHEAPIITEHSRVPRSSAILVLGLEYVEDYNNVRWDKSDRSGQDNPRIKTMSSQTLYQEARELAVDTIKPLHYIEKVTIRFNPDDENKEIQGIVRYSNSPSGYEPIAIHQFMAGAVSANAISFRYLKWRFGADVSEHIDQYGHYVQDYGHWDIAEGEIVYLGHMTLYFKTKRHLVGLFGREEVNLNTKLVKVTLTDQFKQTRELLTKEKPWFPVKEMKNLSSPAEWVFEDFDLLDDDEKSPDKTDKLEKEIEDKPKKKQESDDGDLFF